MFFHLCFVLIIIVDVNKKEYTEMAKQKIRFNYFEPQLIVENNELVTWDMKKFLDAILNNKRSFNASVF